ncbi:hypothetical protein [Actinoplanes sp. NPDC049118]|uniref:hypothetical protein n=1 Tax=Actinoplanes sp. NPDC049118 TaxID=3155769 RepID=UPI0033FB7208
MPGHNVAVLDPDATTTIEQAHHAMQEHLTCETAHCPHRRTALQVLVRHGRYVLATA